LNASGNFVVKTFGKLAVTKTLQFSDIKASKVQEASAVAKRVGYGPVQLWISESTPVEMYE
jgi:hypothetical protein